MGITFRATIGAALILTNTSAAQVGSYAHKRVSETKHYLEKVYGKGLANMLDSQGRPTRERLSWAKTRLGENNWISVGGL